MVGYPIKTTNSLSSSFILQLYLSSLPGNTGYLASFLIRKSVSGMYAQRVGDTEWTLLYVHSPGILQHYPAGTNVNIMKSFIGLILNIGHNRKSNINSYWDTKNPTQCIPIVSTTTVEMKKGDLLAVSWVDRAQVRFLSTNASSGTRNVAVRHGRHGEHREVPNVAIIYNGEMRRVDCNDQLVDQYATELKTNKLWRKVVFHLIDRCATDVRCYGPLDNISCFPHENMLGNLKKNGKASSESCCSDIVCRIASSVSYMVAIQALSYDDAHSDSGCEAHITERLASWAVGFGISHSALSALLEILQSSNLNVPKDPRTLLMTPKVSNIKETAGGSFYHFGVANGIVSKLSTPSCLVDVETLTLYINIDGLPLFGSSTGCIVVLKNQLIFVQEMKAVQKSGIVYNYKKYLVCLDAFICDAPAQAYVKCIKGHSGYNSCERCIQKGVHTGRVTFPEFGAKLLTDTEFNDMRDKAHHTGISPLKELGVGFVSQFVLDYMHLICLGIVWTILFLWMKGPLKSRFSANLLSVISRNLVDVRQSLPREFARKPKSLSEFKMWKATEFRQFLLYTGVHTGRVTFPEFGAKLRTDAEFDDMRDKAHHTGISPLKELGVGFVSQFVLDYMHLICLGIVWTILFLWMKGPLKSRFSANLLSVISRNLADVRQSLPREFARKPKSLSEFKMWKATEFRQFLLYTDVLVYNVHSLTHIVQDVRRYGPLDTISCFPYENMLVNLKKCIYGSDVLVYNVHSLTYIVLDVGRYGPLDNISCFPYENMLEVLQSINLNVPKDPWILLMTPKVTSIKETAGGSFYHFGVANGIISKLSTSSCLVDVETSTLYINIDGLPLFGSSTGCIVVLKNQLIFVQEMKAVQKSGIVYNYKKYLVCLDAFICDAPAQAYVKCIKGHSGYNSCERCIQKGVHTGRVTFPEFGAKLLTDTEFNDMRDKAHHTGISPLKELGVGFVSQFVLDYMHLICLGIVRKIIFMWMKGPLKSRLSANLLSVISRNLADVRQSLPREFARKPRSLSELKCGRLQNSDNVLVYNVHSLTHIVQDVRRYGPLDNISCFPYEKMLGKLKKMVRRPQNPVAQIMRRIAEKDKFNVYATDCSSNRYHQKPPLPGPLPLQYRTWWQYKLYRSDKIFISCCVRDNCFEVDGKIVLVQNILLSLFGATSI
ncbi:PiggyBac transposable element-derived protein 4 [Nymphon striatum]|nr:PiggyBac transposable element-derived protein 4 [Nymphon striatum]